MIKLEDLENTENKFISRKLAAIEAHKRTKQTLVLGYILLVSPLISALLYIFNSLWGSVFMGAIAVITFINIINSYRDLRRLENKYGIKPAFSFIKLNDEKTPSDNNTQSHNT